MTMPYKIKNNMEITFMNYPENERISRILVSAFVAELDPTLEELSDIKTAVSEAVTNAIVHAYPNQEGKIILKLDRIGKNVRIIVSDSGKGIKDVEKAMRPLYTTAHKEERSGMGFTFMEAFMDELQVDSTLGEGTVVSMTKYFGKEKREEEEGEACGSDL